jgi:hypothetical protein
MRHVIEAGTDAATVVLFDPAASSPDDFGPDNIDKVDQLDRDSRIAWVNTGGDGAFLLHAYVDEPVPADLPVTLVDPRVYERFAVPSGRMFFVGGEYCIQPDRAGPSMGGSFDIRPGVYRLTLYRATSSEAADSAHVRARVAPSQRAVLSVGRTLGCLTPVVVIAAMVAVFRLDFQTWVTYVLPTAVLFACVSVLLTRGRAYRTAREAERTAQLELPTMVAHLERLDMT